MNKPIFRLHPLGKMALSLLVMALGFPCWDVRKLLLLCALVLLLLALDPGKGLPLSLLRMSLLSAAVFGVTLLLGDGVSMALGVALHLELMLLLSRWMFRTPVSDLLRGLQSCWIPDGLLLGFLIVFRFIDVLFDELQSIRLAGSMLRRGSLRPGEKFYRCLMLPFVYRLFVLSDQLSLSVTSRDFGAAKRSQYKENQIRAQDVAALAASAAVCGVIVWMR